MGIGERLREGVEKGSAAVERKTRKGEERRIREEGERGMREKESMVGFSPRFSSKESTLYSPPLKPRN